MPAIIITRDLTNDVAHELGFATGWRHIADQRFVVACALRQSWVRYGTSFAVLPLSAAA